MSGTRLGIAGAAFATCAILGSFTAAPPALAANADDLAARAMFVASATTPTTPLQPRHKGPRRRSDGSRLFIIDADGAKRLGSDSSGQVTTLAGYASGSDDITSVGSAAAVNTPARRWCVVADLARGPPAG